VRRVVWLLVAALALPGQSAAQQQQAALTTVIDSIDVVGAHRVPRSQILALADIPVGQVISYRDVQRAIAALYGSGQFEDVTVTQGLVNEGTPEERQLLRITVVERPMLLGWSVRGAEKLSPRTVRGRVKLQEARPFDPAAAQRSIEAIDSLYQKEGFYRTRVRLQKLPQEGGGLRVMLDIEEGRRVAISQVVIDGNHAFTDAQVAGSMKTHPEGFWWFQRGEYDESELDRDIRERIPSFYSEHGYIDFRVVHDTLIVNSATGKGSLHLEVSEGDPYEVGSFEIVGNRRFSTDQLQQFYPFGAGVRSGGFLGLGGGSSSRYFDQARWDQATTQVQTLYGNNGYLYANVRPVLTRRTDSTGTKRVNLRWQITEGEPATINRIEIRGNTVTHENVIRRATFPLVPGDVFRQDALIQAYQNVSNLGFFQQPLAIPDIQPTQNQVDVDVIFRVEERRTGNVNFGASVGQGTGLGGFIGLDEPNVLGRGKRIQFQWQFGRNIQDFNITYSDPAIRGSLISGTLNVHSTRLRYTIADLGRITTRGGSIQLGFPLLGSRYTRLLTSYTLEESNYDSPSIRSLYTCRNCLLSAAGIGIARDRRVDLPFPTGGSYYETRFSLNGGFLGGDGNFRRLTAEGRWYAPLFQLGGGRPDARGLRFVLGFRSEVGFVWGDAGPHFRQLFALGGTQYGIPLRGYDEFSITPKGFDTTATGTTVNAVDAFGKSYFVSTTEFGMRVSQAVYVSLFYDAGNVWATPGQFAPTRLFRGAGIGVALLSPLGPIGLDYAYGFDKVDSNGNPAPGWKLHFRLGNIF
jgi:outer membrane protein insertion porin family